MESCVKGWVIGDYMFIVWNSIVQICTINHKLFMFGIVSSDRTKYNLKIDNMPKYTNIEVFGSWKWKEKLILYLLPRDQPNQSAVVSILRIKYYLFDFPEIEATAPACSSRGRARHCRLRQHCTGFGNFLLAPWSSWYNYQSCQVDIWNFCTSKGHHYQLVPWSFCCSCPKSSQKSLSSPHSWQCPLPRSSKAPWNSFGFSLQSPFPSRPWNWLMSFPIPGEDCGNYGCARTPSSSSGCFRPACSHSGSVLLPGPASSWEPSRRPIPLLGSQKFSQVAVDFHTSKKVFSLWAQMWLCIADPPLDRAEVVQKLKEQSYSPGKFIPLFFWLSFPSCEFSLCWQITTSLPGADRSGRRGKVLPVS